MRPHFDVRPAEAERFTGPDSVAAVADLVVKYRPRVSWDYSPALETLRFYNSGTELNLKLRDWVAVVHGDVAVIPPALFEGSIVPGEEGSDLPQSRSGSDVVKRDDPCSRGARKLSVVGE